MIFRKHSERFRGLNKNSRGYKKNLDKLRMSAENSGGSDSGSFRSFQKVSDGFQMNVMELQGVHWDFLEVQRVSKEILRIKRSFR